MLVIAVLGHSKQREVVHSTIIRESSTVEMSYNKIIGHWLYYYYVFVCIYYPCTSVQGNVFACVAYMVVEQS